MIRKKNTLFLLLSFSFIFLFFSMMDSGAQISKIRTADTKTADTNTGGKAQAKNTTVKFEKPAGPAQLIKGDKDVGSKNGQRTNWELEVSLAPARPDASGLYSAIKATYTYIVKEDKPNYTILQYNGTQEISVAFRFRELKGQKSQAVNGIIKDQHHDLVNVTSQIPGNNLIRELSVKIDSDKSDDTSQIHFSGTFYIEYE